MDREDIDEIKDSLASIAGSLRDLVGNLDGDDETGLLPSLVNQINESRDSIMEGGFKHLAEAIKNSCGSDNTMAIERGFEDLIQALKPKSVLKKKTKTQRKGKSK